MLKSRSEVHSVGTPSLLEREQYIESVGWVPQPKQLTVSSDVVADTQMWLKYYRRVEWMPENMY